MTESLPACVAKEGRPVTMERKVFYWIFLLGCLHESSVTGKIVSQLPSRLPSRTDQNVGREIWEKSNPTVGNIPFDKLDQLRDNKQQRVNDESAETTDVPQSPLKD